MVGDHGVDIDSRLCRRMKRRSKANRSCRAARVIGKNVAVVAVPGTTEVIAIHNDSEYVKDLEGSGIPGYVDHLDGCYGGSDVHNTNVDNSSGYGADKCADDGNAEAGSDVSIDPDYKVFLDNARGKNNAMILCLGNVVVRYGYSEDDAESSSQEKTCDSRTVNTKAKVNMNNADNPVCPRFYHCGETTLLKSKIKGSNKLEKKHGREPDPDYISLLSSMEVDATSGRSGRCKEVRYSQGENNQYDQEALENKCRRDCDPDYISFLSSMRVDATSRRSGQCKKVRYSQNEKNQYFQEVLESNKPEKNSVVKLGDSGSQNESDSDVIILELDPSFGGERTPFVSSKAYEVFLDDCTTPNFGRKGSSEYREELIAVLKKPFANDEYLQLRKEVFVRKPVERHKDLRSGPKPFKTKIMGKSYMDKHKDVHSKIVEAKPDKLKVLNILRGFFFWLQNLSREGAFQPWLDPSILDIRPHK